MNERRKIQTDQAPQAIGPYAQAQQVGSFIFTSGQIPLDLNGQVVPGGIEAQTRQVIENARAVLQAAGADLENVIKVTLFIQNMNDFQQINAIYNEYFAEIKPARSCVEVSRLPKDVEIEMECIAISEK